VNGGAIVHNADLHQQVAPIERSLPNVVTSRRTGDSDSAGLHGQNRDRIEPAGWLPRRTSSWFDRRRADHARGAGPGHSARGRRRQRDRDGKLAAVGGLKVHIFPESMRGAGEGHQPWEQPGTTMTNANVDAVGQRTDGSMLTLASKGFKVRVLVPPDTPIVRFEPGHRALIVPGASIVLFRPTPAVDGTLRAARVTVGINGARLPM